ncbi:MAG: hypothetical protein RSA43_03015 [Victivallaceae bacterium]
MFFLQDLSKVMSDSWTIEFSSDYYLRSLELCIRDSCFRLVAEGNWWRAIPIDSNLENTNYHLLAQRLDILLRNKRITLFSLEALLSAIDEKKLRKTEKKRKNFHAWNEILFITHIKKSILNKLVALRDNRH